MKQLIFAHISLNYGAVSSVYTKSETGSAEVVFGKIIVICGLFTCFILTNLNETTPCKFNMLYFRK